MNAGITIRRSDRLYGPYSAGQIREMLDTGSVALDDEAWSESEGRWTTLRHILAPSTEPSNSNVDETRLTAADILGDPPGADPAAEIAYSQRQDRVARILSAVGLVAIALGTIDAAIHMKAPKSPTAAECPSNSPRISSEHPERPGLNGPPK
jgi:hypothetical protein